MHVCKLFSALLVLVCITNMLGYVLIVSTFISPSLLARFTPMISSLMIPITCNYNWLLVAYCLQKLYIWKIFITNLLMKMDC